MSREVDLRDPAVYIDAAADATELSGLGDLREDGNYIQRALDFATNVGSGLMDGDPPDLSADPHVPQTSTGAAVVNLHQQSSNIPIFQATQTVRFDPGGILTGSSGSLIAITQDTNTLPNLTVEQAMLQAAQYVAETNSVEEEDTDPFGEPIELPPIDLSGFVPKIIANFPSLPAQPAVLGQGPFGEPIKANLVWFPLIDSLRLAWEITMTMPNHEGQFHMMVDGEDGGILFSTQVVSAVEAQGNVYRIDGGRQREMTSFSPLWTDYDLPIPTDLPATVQLKPIDWVESETAGTAGNSTIASQGQNGPTVHGVRHQDGVLTFDPANPLGTDQRIVNAFYYSCYMHDFFYLLGFREGDGNFQLSNSEQGSLAGDRVDVQVYDGPVFLTASMSTNTVDGTGPVMKLGLVTTTNRHTALDRSIVFHEFFHGLSSRLVGGPMNGHSMEAAQSKGLGEGLSDYVACTLTNTAVVGSWVVDDPAGIREFPYDDTYPTDTANFGSLGAGRYTRPHNIGEVYAAALLEIGRRIDSLDIGEQVSSILVLQLIIDALKLVPANPSFLDMRDAVLLALDHKRTAGTLASDQHSAIQQSMWQVFANFGMGPNARSSASTLGGIVADFDVPASTPTTPT